MAGRVGPIIVLVLFLFTLGTVFADTVTTSVRYLIPSSIGFTIFLPANNATGVTSGSTQQILFNTTNGSTTKINATTVGGFMQNETVAIFRYRSDANVAINITLALDTVPTCSGGTIVTKAGWNYTSWEGNCTAANLTAAGACVNITATSVRVANLSTNGYTRDVWLWADYSSCPGNTDVTKTLTHTSLAG